MKGLKPISSQSLDETNEPIERASVYLSGTTIGQSTKADGTYELSTWDVTLADGTVPLAPTGAAKASAPKPQQKQKTKPSKPNTDPSDQGSLF